MNCLPGDVAYFCRGVVSPEVDASPPAAIARGLYGHVVEIQTGDWDDARQQMWWRVRPMEITRVERGMEFTATISKVDDRLLVPIAGTRRQALVWGYDHDEESQG